MLGAELSYVPYTTVAEVFGSTTCGGCAIAWTGIQEVHTQTHPGEFVTAKLYTQSGEFSTQEVLDRFDYYEVIGIPSVMFNGKIRVDGSGDGIVDGSRYLESLNQFRYSSSPINVEISNFSTSPANLSGRIVMISPTAQISNAKVVYYILEDNITDTQTNVVRRIMYDDFNLSGPLSSFTFDKDFAIDPSWNAANLWAIVSVQLDNKTIVQSASTKSQPMYQVRGAMNWNPNITGPANSFYSSQPFWIYNTGSADDFTTTIEVDSAPADWYFNYCDEAGNCYTGNVQVPLYLGDGEAIPFHHNIIIGSPGVAYFRFVISSSNIGSYSIPFRYAVEGVSNDDSTLSPTSLQLGAIHPNPVTSTARIMLNNGKNLNDATIDVFNLKGQKVQSLFVKLNQGENHIDFLPNSALSNGIYFYRLAGTNQTPKKFILMR
jgi:hypothetical protein